MNWHIIINIDQQEKVAIKYAALQQGVSAKEWIKNTLLDAVYPKEVKNVSTIKDSFSPGFVDL